eukprot:3250831-Prymnesium_polylepis.1
MAAGGGSKASEEAEGGQQEQLRGKVVSCGPSTLQEAPVLGRADVDLSHLHCARDACRGCLPGVYDPIPKAGPISSVTPARPTARQESPES